MKLISTLRIFVAILFLISPIDILCEKIPKYTLQNHVQRKLEVNSNYIRVQYGEETTYIANEFKNLFKQSVYYIKYKGHVVDLENEFTIEANTNIEIYFSEPITSLYAFFMAIDDYDPYAKNIKLIDFSHFYSLFLEDTENLFRECSSLEEINFNNFDTSKITSMVDMFYGCSNLKSLDLSNFNTSKVTLSDFMFYNCTSIKYINLYNAYINDDIKSQIEEIVKNTTIVCQKEKIINKGIKDCSIFNLPDNEFSFFESNNLSNTTTQIISTIKEISTTFPEIKNEETNVVLLGFSQFRQFKENFTFYIYFTATKYILYTKHILFPMEITYNRNIRRLLKEAKANCTLDQVESDIKYKYYCQVDKEPDNIKEVKLIPDFNFVSQDNVTLTGITPLAKMFINNMTTLTQDNIYGNILENSFIYIMDNSNFYKYDKFLFNITGEINDPQPKLDNKNLLLMINLENNDTKDIQIQCNISNITGNNYILHCKSNESFKGEMQSAVSFIDNDDILLLNFVDIKESNINIEATRNNRKFFIKKASKLGAGAIVGIIIPIIVAIALIAFVIFHFKKKNKKDVNDSNSSIKEFKIPDGIKH